MKLLLAKGAAPDAALKGATLRWGRRRGPGDGALVEGATPLMRAARLADVAAMRALLDAGADMSRKQKNGTSVLMLAAGAGWRTGETILGGRGLRAGRHAGGLYGLPRTGANVKRPTPTASPPCTMPWCEAPTSCGSCSTTAPRSM